MTASHDRYRPGSTRVVLHEGKIYFWGDVRHCGKRAIFHNARKIKEELLARKAKFAHKNYNDLPSFDSEVDWDGLERDRKEAYEDDLYCFENKKIKVADLIGEEEQTRMAV